MNDRVGADSDSLNNVKISFYSGCGSICSGSEILFKVINTAWLGLQQTPVSYLTKGNQYICKLSAYSADVCKLPSLSLVCGYKPLIHTAEAKPTLFWSEVFKTSPGRGI